MLRLNRSIKANRSKVFKQPRRKRECLFHIINCIRSWTQNKVPNSWKKLCLTTISTKRPKGLKPGKSCLFLPAERKTTPNYPSNWTAKRPKNILKIVILGLSVGRVVGSSFSFGHFRPLGQEGNLTQFFFRPFSLSVNFWPKLGVVAQFYYKIATLDERNFLISIFKLSYLNMQLKIATWTTILFHQNLIFTDILEIQGCHGVADKAAFFYPPSPKGRGIKSRSLSFLYSKLSSKSTFKA